MPLAHSLLVVIVIIGSAVACRQSPEEAMKAFYANSEAECTLEDPLWTAGREVVPLVIADVARRDMPRRRYAISFLGNIGDRRALNTLQQIVDDSSEIEYFRADALQAIHKIDPEVGAAFAAVNDSSEGLLGEYSRIILQGGEFERYGFWDRMLGRRCNATAEDKITQEELAARTAAYCAWDTHQDNQSFKAERWRGSGALERGLMARDLICSPSLYIDKGRQQVLGLLGPPDFMEGRKLAYRVVRDRPLVDGWVPVPPGHQRSPNGYDLVVVFTSTRDVSNGVYVRVAFEPTANNALKLPVTPLAGASVAPAA